MRLGSQNGELEGLLGWLPVRPCVKGDFADITQIELVHLDTHKFQAREPQPSRLEDGFGFGISLSDRKKNGLCNGRRKFNQRIERRNALFSHVLGVDAGPLESLMSRVLSMRLAQKPRWTIPFGKVRISAL